MKYIHTLLCLLMFGCHPPPAPADDIPPNALLYLPTLKAQVSEVWPAFPTPYYFGALIEHESCISLTSKRCWSPTSRLLTPREEGAGLGQITRTFNKDGSIRFDALADAKHLDPVGLNDLRWETVYQRPDLQMRVMILMTRKTYNQISRLTQNPLPFTDAAYNGGLGGVLNERRACNQTPGCNPDEWFGHVEHHCLKSKKPLYGNRSACDINRHHVEDVLLNRMPKYRRWM